MQDAIRTCADMVELEMADMLSAVSGCTDQEREYLDRHVEEVRARLEGRESARDDAGVCEVRVTPLTRERAMLVLRHTYGMRKAIEKVMSRWCLDPRYEVEARRWCGRTLAAVCSLEFAIERRYPDLMQLEDKPPPW